MRTVLWLCITLVLTAGLLAAQVAEPLAGFTLDQERSLRPLMGVAGAYVLGERVAERVDEFAVSSTLALWTAGGVLTIADRRTGAAVRQEAPGPVFLAVRGEQAIAYLEEKRELWAYREGALSLVDRLELPGRVLAMSGGAERQVWLVRDGETIWRLATEASAIAMREPLADVAEPALLLADEEGIAYGQGDGLVIRRGTEEQKVPVAALRLRHSQPGWVLAESELRSYAIRLRDGAVYELPRTAQEANP